MEICSNCHPFYTGQAEAGGHGRPGGALPPPRRAQPRLTSATSGPPDCSHEACVRRARQHRAGRACSRRWRRLPARPRGDPRLRALRAGPPLVKVRALLARARRGRLPRQDAQRRRQRADGDALHAARADRRRRASGRSRRRASAKWRNSKRRVGAFGYKQIVRKLTRAPSTACAWTTAGTTRTAPVVSRARKRSAHLPEPGGAAQPAGADRGRSAHGATDSDRYWRQGDERRGVAPAESVPRALRRWTAVVAGTMTAPAALRQVRRGDQHPRPGRAELGAGAGGP